MSAPTTRRATVEVFDPTPTRDTSSLLQTVLLITSWQGPQRKHCFHCYSPTIPRPLHAFPLPREHVYRAVAYE
jgi:hypothetical protein